MSEPIVFGPAFSTYVRSTRLTLEEKGVPYRLEEVNILEGANKSPEHLARHPFGKVPAFEHDGFALYETAAIMRYVDEAFDGPALQPSEARARARMTQVLSVVNSYVYPSWISAIVMQRVVAPLLGGEPDEAAIREALPQAETCVAALDALLEGDDVFAAGALSLADLHVAPIYDYFSQTPEGERLLAGAANLQRWWGGVSRRDSLAKTKPALG